MRAAVLRAPGGGLNVEEVQLDDPRAGELTVRVEAAGVCHTELHYMSGQIPSLLPVVLGHEGTGVVEAVGASIDDIAVGDRVVFTWRPRCGHCVYCVSGRPAMCVYGRVQAASGGLMDGTSRLRQGSERVHHFLGVSCFAERTVVSRCAVVPIPLGVPAPVAAIVGCAVVTGVGAMTNVAASQGSIAGTPVVVMGAGGVGLCAILGALLLGAAPVVAVDLAPSRLELATRLGASEAIDARGMDTEAITQAIKDTTGGGPEIAVDAVGSGPVLAQAFRALRPGGTIIAVGLSSTQAEISVPLNELVQQQKHITGSLYGSANPGIDLPRLLALYEDGRLPLDQLVGETYDLDGVGEAYAALAEGDVGRAVIIPG